jgi:signal transduction histidine kinase
VADPQTGEIRHFFALQTDVTLRRKAEDAALLHALELERIFSSAPVGMLTFDMQDCVHLVSPALLSMFKVTGNELIGQPRAGVPAVLRKALGHKEDTLPWTWPTVGQPVRWTMPGGSHHAVEVSLSHLDEITRECVVLFRDVSEELAQVVSRSQFLATAAHELRTPMGSIKGFTELLLMRDFSNEEARPLLETILNQSMRLSAMLNDLLDLSRVDALGSQAFTVKPMALMPVVQRAVQLVSMPGMRRGIQLQLPKQAVRVHGNPAKLEQVIINLLSNAIKYSATDSPVSLAVEADPVGERWHVHVTDQGIGLSEADQAKLFTRFFRANPNGPIPGTGLGLVIAKELIERMGGEVTVRSELGKGSMFTITLLACADVGAMVSPVAAASPAPSPATRPQLENKGTP